MASHLSCGLDCRIWSPPPPPPPSTAIFTVPRSNIFPTTNLPEYPQSSHNPHRAIPTTRISNTLTKSLSSPQLEYPIYSPSSLHRTPLTHGWTKYSIPNPNHLTSPCLNALSPQLLQSFLFLTISPSHLPSSLCHQQHPNPWSKYTTAYPPHLTTLTALSPQLEFPISYHIPLSPSQPPLSTIPITQGTRLTKVYHSLPTLLKRLAIFPSPAWMSVTILSLAWNN